MTHSSSNQSNDFEHTGIIHILTKYNGLWLKHIDDKAKEIHAESNKEWKQFIQSQPSSIIRDWIKQLGTFQSEDKALKHIIKTNPLCCPKIRSKTDAKLTSRILNFIETIQRYSVEKHRKITVHDPHSDYSESIRDYSSDSREQSASIANHAFAVHFDKMPLHWSYQRIAEYFSIFGSASLYLRRDSKNKSSGSGYLYFKDRSSAEWCVKATKYNRFHVEFVHKSSLHIRHRSRSPTSARRRSARSRSKTKKKDRKRSRHRSRSRSRPRSSRSSRKHKRHSSRGSRRHKNKDKHIRKEQTENNAKTCVPIEETDTTKQTEKDVDSTPDYTVLDYMESDAAIERKPVHQWNCYAVIYWLNRVHNGYLRGTKYINLRKHICIGKVNGNQLCHLNDVTLNMIGIYDTNEIDIILNAVSELIYTDRYNNVIANTMRADNIPSMYCDPVSFELMMDPVYLGSANDANGNVYERRSIEEYVTKYGKDPLTHKIVKCEEVVAADCLKKKIESWTHNNVITMC
eukprot:782965_1